MELEENTTVESALKALNKAPNTDNPQDVPDIPPKSSEISNWDIFFLVLSIVMHCCDVCVDISLVARYFINEKMSTFAWTISLILVPSLINTIVSLQMYQQDEQVISLGNTALFFF